MISALLLALALASPAPAGLSATTIDAALVRGEGLELAEVERALRVRLPSLALVEQGGDMPPGTGTRAFVDLRRTSPTQIQVALILSDGRAYFRTVDTEGEAPARPVAGALALLIAAIEDDSVAPDERDVPVPPAIAAPSPEPVADTPAPTCPAVPPCPQPAPPAPAPALELGLVPSAGATFGLGQPLAGVRGAQLGLGLDVRWRRGALVAVEVRTALAPVDRHTLARVRAAVGGGFALRVRSFELPIVGLLGVEWWGISGARTEVQRAGGGQARPLLGGGLRLSPGLWVRYPGGALRAGVRAELWGSGEVGPGGPRRPLLVRPGGAPIAAVGGAELSAGLELAVWFDPGRRKPTRTGPK